MIIEYRVFELQRKEKEISNSTGRQIGHVLNFVSLFLIYVKVVSILYFFWGGKGQILSPGKYEQNKFTLELKHLKVKAARPYV